MVEQLSIEALSSQDWPEIGEDEARKVKAPLRRIWQDDPVTRLSAAEILHDLWFEDREVRSGSYQYLILLRVFR
jgi:hypothetical protein